MARLGYKCDGCGDEYPNQDPAAYHDGDELCSDCYDERWSDE